MIARQIPPFALAPLIAALSTAPLAAQSSGSSAPTPSSIVAAAPASDWREIAADDLIVMRLSPPSDGAAREVVMQLVPPPFAQAWTANIRTLARAHWWDGLSINRVQDNYVVQWGDADGEEAAKAKPLPAGLVATTNAPYVAANWCGRTACPSLSQASGIARRRADAYAVDNGYLAGWPVAQDGRAAWPVHCYGMVGVGRGMAPDRGTGAELYTVIGHAPRHLDRNIAVVGRVIAGIEHLSSLPRGTGALGFYERPEQRVAIQSIRLASELSPNERPRFEYLRTDTPTFARLVEARANRRDSFFVVPAGGVDVCNVNLPIRRVAQPSR